MAAKNLLQLPKDVLYQILAVLPPENLRELCKTNVSLSKTCRAQDFWDFKYQTQFGRPFPRPDPRIVYYRAQSQALYHELSDLDAKLRARIVEMIMSTVRPEDKAEVEDIADYIQGHLAPLVVVCLNNDMSVSDCFNDFHTELVTKLKEGGPLPARGRPPVRGRAYQFISHINRDADILRQYPRYDLGGALGRAIFDVILEHQYQTMDLRNELTRLQVHMARLR